MDFTSAAEEATSSVTIADSLPMIRVRPSQFNARTVAKDGTLILFNSFSGAFSGLPPQARAKAEILLRREGCSIEQTGLAKYMLDRGFLIPYETHELNKLRAMFGYQHYRSDRMDLILLASEECNFRCVYCYEAFSRGTMEPWVRQAIVAMAERRINQLRLLHVRWFGGEPLLGLEAIREIAPRLQFLARENGVKYSSNMTTNGYLLTQKVLEELLSYGISHYQITLDGSPIDHDCKRGLKGGGSSFQTIYDNLRAARSLSAQFTILIRINFDQDNLPHVQELLDQLEEDFAGDRRFELLFYPVGKWGGANDESLNICGDARYSSRLALAKTAARMGLNPQSHIQQMQGQTGVGVCYAARPHDLLVGASGKIMKCTVALDQQDINVVGHMKSDGVPEIDHEKLARWIAPHFESDETCKKCFYLPVCQGSSCPKTRFNPGKRPCPEEKTKIVFTLNSLWEARQTTANQYRLRRSGLGVDVKNTEISPTYESNGVSIVVSSTEQEFGNKELSVVVQDFQSMDVGKSTIP